LDYSLGWGIFETDYDAKILGQLDRAIVLAPAFDPPYQLKGLYLAFSHRWDEAVRAADAGLAVNPNKPYLYASWATAEIHLGRLDEAKSDVRQAIRLSPHDPWTTWFDRTLGDVEFVSGHLEAAIVEYRKALDAGDHSWFVYENLAASYALSGKMDEAKRFVAETLRVNPSFTTKWYREHTSVIPGREEGLRKAGFAEE
jgi:tetratricopeptide (TPR) repeat protein